jgi:hypothetical protein
MHVEMPVPSQPATETLYHLLSRAQIVADAHVEHQSHLQSQNVAASVMLAEMLTAADSAAETEQAEAAQIQADSALAARLEAESETVHVDKRKSKVGLDFADSHEVPAMLRFFSILQLKRGQRV